ncbi:MAG: STAS domain-containing protein [Vicinamibacteria bacterium]
MPEARSRLPEIMARHQKEILADWQGRQAEALGGRRDVFSPQDLAHQSAALLEGIRKAAAADLDVHGSAWHEVRDILAEISTQYARQGLSPSQTATFVFSLKLPLFTRLRGELGKDADALADEIWVATVLLDALGLYTTEIYQKGREQVIARQQSELLELSTPVVKLWEGVLALPLVGTLDSARAQVVMESLLHQIVETGSEVAIIDITGVPTVDTLVAQHLLKTIAAARLMGADCIISGIRPQIAQTIVHLGVDLGDVLTKANLADALMVALRRSGFVVSRGTAQAEAR